MLTKNELQLLIDAKLEELNPKIEHKIDINIDFRLLGNSVIRTLGNSGFRYKGLNYINLDMFREHEIGSKFELIEDIDNLKKAYVYSLEGEFICEVEDLEAKNLSAEAVKEIQKEYKKNFTAAKRALIKDGKYLKNSHYKGEAERLNALRDSAYENKKEELLREEDKGVNEEIIVANEAYYEPYMPPIEDAVNAFND